MIKNNNIYFIETV